MNYRRKTVLSVKCMQAAVKAVLRCARSERDSKKCQLDRALTSLDGVLDPARSAELAHSMKLH